MNLPTPLPDRPINVDRYVEAGKTADAGDNHYKNLRIHALRGLHAEIASRASRHFDAGATVLDLAAGSGAMSLRLLDLGFEVHATDYVDSAFALHGRVPFRQADLNADFAADFGRTFDAVVASEIIEHLENPRHFARQVFRLLRPGGTLLLSTPNVDSVASKLTFLTSGRFLWFDDPQYRSDGHITPVTQWQIDKLLAEAGFAVLSISSFGDATQRLAGSPRLRLLARLVERLQHRASALGGEVLIVVAQRPHD